jgi:uncharacterized membrane protein
MPTPQQLAIASFAALAVLAVAVELWIAPLRPGGSLLALKALPLAAAIPSLRRGGARAYQWWSMLILGYLGFGLVRGASDAGLTAAMGWLEAALSTVAFVALIAHVRSGRSTQATGRADG